MRRLHLGVFHLSVFSTLVHLGVVGAIRRLLGTRSPLLGVYFSGGVLVMGLLSRLVHLVPSWA